MPFQFVPKVAQDAADRLRAPRLALRDEAIDFASCESLYCHGRNVHDSTLPADYIFENRRTGDSWGLQVLEAKDCLAYVDSRDWPQHRAPDLLAVFVGGPSSATAPSPAKLAEALGVLLKMPGLAVHWMPNWTELRALQHRPPAPRSGDALVRYFNGLPDADSVRAWINLHAPRYDLYAEWPRGSVDKIAVPMKLCIHGAQLADDIKHMRACWNKGTMFTLSRSQPALYRVVVGGVAGGVAHEPVAARLATRFKRPEQEMLTMVKMDKAIVKRGISFEKAQEYFAVLTDAGCATMVEKESSFD
jgi:hypothetical protein